MQAPFVFYLLYPNSYKIFMMAVLLTVICHYVLRSKGRKAELRSNICVKHYTVFFYVTFILSLVASLYRQKFDALHFTNFFVQIIQFYFIFYLIIQLNNNEKVLNLLYSLAIILSFLSIIKFMLVFWGHDPLPIISIATVSGPIQLNFPFGVVRGQYSSSAQIFSYYRSYSYFLEPAKYAYFIMPFIYYSIYKWDLYRERKYLLSLLILIIALLLTMSTGGIGTLLISMVIISLCSGSFKKKIANVLVFLILLCIFISGFLYFEKLYPTEAGIILNRRQSSIQMRLGEWSQSGKGISEKIIGESIGSESAYTLSSNLVKEKTGGINSFYFRYLYYFGLVGLFSLTYFIYYNLKYIFKSLRRGPPFLKAVASMVLSLLIFNISINLMFFGYSLIILSIFYSEVNNQNTRRKCEVLQES